MHLVVVSGLSGSGKSVALNVLEDLGWYCIDNIPAGLVRGLVAHSLQTAEPLYQRLAVGIDARNRPADLATLPLIRELGRAGLRSEVLYLHADDEVLLRRYAETRRPHPLAGAGRSLADAITEERRLLHPLIDAADLVINTSRTSVHELRERLGERLGDRGRDRLSILFQSFGFKHGLPADADFVFDARTLPNPYWEPQLQALSGLDPAVVAFLQASPAVHRLCDDLCRFLAERIPEYERASRGYLTVAIGCTGGQHRSVYVVERIAAHFRPRYPQLLVRHNALPRAAAQPPETARDRPGPGDR
ncbi:MAG: RNase adapter RapZ [Gammaproteobacteria bacterium]|nr:RNase adapter RapZ [Gammaproteobacteria bacterium]